MYNSLAASSIFRDLQKEVLPKKRKDSEELLIDSVEISPLPELVSIFSSLCYEARYFDNILKSMPGGAPAEFEITPPLQNNSVFSLFVS